MGTATSMTAHILVRVWVYMCVRETERGEGISLVSNRVWNREPRKDKMKTVHPEGSSRTQEHPMFRFQQQCQTQSLA